MEVPYLNLAVAKRAERERLQQIFARGLETGQFILGEALEKFEMSFAQTCTVRYAVGVNSGTDALFLALKGLGIGAGDEVITVANSFIATAGAITATGAKPVFVDVTTDDMLMDPTRLESAIGPRTKAIVPVHLTGLVCEMEQIQSIAEKHQLFVIEDAAQSVNATYCGRQAGSLGNCGAFSLIPLKNLGGIGDGGVLVTENKALYQKVCRLRNHGLKNRDHAEEFGFNSRLDTINASILIDRLARLEQITRQKRQMAEAYHRQLDDLRASGILKYSMGSKRRRHVFHLFVIRTEARNNLREYLHNKGVETKVHYPVPIHRQAAYVRRFGQVSLPVTEQLSEEMLSLPIWLGMPMDKLEYVASSIRKFFKGRR